MHIQFVKYPLREMYFALYSPPIEDLSGRHGSDYMEFLEQVSADLKAVDREGIRYAFNMHFPPEDRELAVKVLMLESDLEQRVEGREAPMAKVLQFRRSP